MGATLKDAAPLFAALGDRTRLLLVARLGREGPLSTTRLAADVVVTRQAVTKHLQALEKVGLAGSRRSGRERVWELRPRGLARAQRHLDQISTQWDASLVRLRVLVEEEQD